MIDIRYQDERLLVCIKPPKILSTDEPGGLPELLRAEYGFPALYTVHRLDRAAGGLILLAKDSETASQLGRQIMAHGFDKEYLAAVHGCPEPPEGTFSDLLGRDRARKMTFVAPAPAKGVQEALLHYTVTASADGCSLVRIALCTGRTHQIRVQFASRGLPLLGERKYSTLDDPCPLALWSCRLAFTHPATGQRVDVSADPPRQFPWDLF